MSFVRAERMFHNPMKFALPAFHKLVPYRQDSALFPSSEQNCIRICDWLREIPSSMFSFRLLCGLNGNAEQKVDL